MHFKQLKINNPIISIHVSRHLINNCVVLLLPFVTWKRSKIMRKLGKVVTCISHKTDTDTQNYILWYGIKQFVERHFSKK